MVILVQISYERESDLYHELQTELEKLNEKSAIVKRVKFILNLLECTLEEYSDERLEKYLIEKINDEVESCSSLRLCDLAKELSINRPTIARPRDLSRFQQKIFFQLLTFNFGLGNRASLPGFDKTETCTICSEYGINAQLNEAHFAIR